MRLAPKNRIMFFDVETTGLLPHRNENITLQATTVNKFPHILQLSFIVFNMISRRVENHGDFYIKPPPGICIPKIVTEMTGITKELCDSKGVSIEQAMNSFHGAYMSSDTVVSHNLYFDKKMIEVEQFRHNELFALRCPGVLNMFNPVYDDLYKIDNFCTMQASIDLCNIEVPRKDGKGTYKKFPKLEELYEHLFSAKPENLHNSIVDTLVGLRCYLKLRHGIDMTDCEFDYLMSSYL